MLVSVSEIIEGYKIVEHKGIVVGVGNSSTDGRKYRDVAIKNLTESAQALGANAISNVRLDVNNVLGSTVEATAYGNAVIIESINAPVASHQERVNYNKFITSNMDKDESAQAEILDMNGFKFVVCPKCKSKYKADIDAEGHVHIKGFDDVDDNEPGLQVYCIRCGSKFTVPENN